MEEGTVRLISKFSSLSAVFPAGENQTIHVTHDFTLNSRTPNPENPLKAPEGNPEPRKSLNPP